MQTKSQKERTWICIRKKTKKVFNKNAEKHKLSKIDYMDKLVNEDYTALNKGEKLSTV
jgi:hypothetical protein